MLEVFRLVQSAATSPIPVLVEGETGTGKELVARSIHDAGPRADEPFVAVNCAALPEQLLESELFGHRRGAFTGATSDQIGLFEAASGGTIFLDEVGEPPLPMQAKLLRVLEESEVLPVGERRPRKIDVRVVTATNRDLSEEIAARRFRDDLFYRIAAFPIRLPALRERREDVPLLVDRFLADAAARHGKTIPGVEPRALERLLGFDWPGNVRELKNELARAVALASDGEKIDMTHLSPRLAGGTRRRPRRPRRLCRDARRRVGRPPPRPRRVRSVVHRTGSEAARRKRDTRGARARHLARRAPEQDEGVRAPVATRCAAGA
jgi:two-component system response regulator HupR/HoxA